MLNISHHTSVMERLLKDNFEIVGTWATGEYEDYNAYICFRHIPTNVYAWGINSLTGYLSWGTAKQMAEDLETTYSDNHYQLERAGNGGTIAYIVRMLQWFDSGAMVDKQPKSFTTQNYTYYDSIWDDMKTTAELRSLERWNNTPDPDDGLEDWPY